MKDQNQNNEWEYYSNILNVEFGGKTIMHCNSLNGGNFAVTPGKLKVCGSATHEKGSPDICKYNEPNVCIEEFLSGLGNIIRGNQTKKGNCVGCRYLTKMELPEEFVAPFFSSISLHDFCGCNAKCVYCFGSEFFLPEKYKASFDHKIFFQNLYKQGLIKSNVTIVFWGGGEPSLLNTFEQTVDYLRTMRIKQMINTSGIKFSSSIEKVLKEELGIVRISVDSGTNETYLMVKGNVNSDLVWESIKCYASTIGDFIVKYIIFSMNSDINEIEKFIDRCYHSGVKKICISVDVRSIFTINSDQPKISLKELVAAALMHNLAISKKIEIYFESIWLPEHIEKIKAICNYQEMNGNPKFRENSSNFEQLLKLDVFLEKHYFIRFIFRTIYKAVRFPFKIMQKIGK